MLRQVGGALQALHGAGILHLDVKPENVIYESNDAQAPLKLADFGCSVLAQRVNADTK